MRWSLSSVLLVAVFGHATVTVEPDSESYHFVKSYQVEISATPQDVWPHLSNLRSWMVDFELSSISGEPGQTGEVLRLYEGQEFQIQIIAADPPRLLGIANLPLTFQGELSQGVAFMQLVENDGGTVLSLIMSRRYTWTEDGENPLLVTRKSVVFNENTDAMWIRFLDHLKRLAELPN
ncbi:MAG: hypothetical protein GKR90_16535 [Pseudomonadales bacterium]|nr:hypothetical protein [Pseudomonadales bacterium]